MKGEDIMSPSKANLNILRLGLLLVCTLVPEAVGAAQNNKKPSPPPPSRPAAPSRPAPQQRAPQASRTVTGPGTRTVTGPGTRTVTGPGPRTVTGPGTRTVTGPGPRTVTGPGTRTVTGPGTRTAPRITKTFTDRSGRAASATFRPNGRVATIHANGMTINHGLRGERTIVSEHNGRTIVSTGGHDGYVQRPYFTRNGREYVQRTYVVNHVTYTTVYRSYYYGGARYYGYAPVYYYHPVFYGWAYNPWPEPVYYGWGWGGAP